MSYQILEGCIMCSACKNECLFAAIQDDKEKRVHYIDEEKCVECDRCVGVCPIGLIQRNEATESRKRFSGIRILKDKCIGCSLCARFCPAKAITGQIKTPYSINPDKCIRCGVCLTKCRKEAIEADFFE